MPKFDLLVCSRAAGAIGVFSWTRESVKAESLEAAIDSVFNDRSREYNVVTAPTEEALRRASLESFSAVFESYTQKSGR